MVGEMNFVHDEAGSSATYRTPSQCIWIKVCVDLITSFVCNSVPSIPRSHFRDGQAPRVNILSTKVLLSFRINPKSSRKPHCGLSEMIRALS